MTLSLRQYLMEDHLWWDMKQKFEIGKKFNESATYYLAKDGKQILQKSTRKYILKKNFLSKVIFFCIYSNQK